ncbi:MAG TPA: histidine phosphatase family protein [Candidatus Limnocylindria bacterium]|nr:histidine phosphatase family protein [Candidatus Limnocylindria bacterium]
MKALRVFVIRHGETDFSRARRFAGARDVPLTARGRLQSEAVAAALAAEPLTAVYASPLERARASAELIAKPHGLEPRLAPVFREMAFGQWEGLLRDELAARSPADATAWRDTPHLAAPPGGERLAEVAARVGEGVAMLRDSHAGATVALVTHAIVTRLIVLQGLGLGPERLWSVDASPAGITELEYQGEWVTVHRMNTVAHLDGTP